MHWIAPTSRDANTDTLDSTLDSATYKRPTVAQVGYADRAGVGLDSSGDLARDVLATRKVAGTTRLLKDVTSAFGERGAAQNR